MALLDQALLLAVQQPVSHGIFGKVFTFAQMLHPLDDAAKWYDLSLGMRDKYLMEIRASVFGYEFEGTATCHECSEIIEFNIQIQDFLPLSCSDASFEISHNNTSYHFRAPSTRDLLVCFDLPEHLCLPDLVKQLSLGPETDNEADFKDRKFVEKINTGLEKKQSISDIVLTAVCPECQTNVTCLFDIVQVLDADISNAAGLLLEEIHQLANAYGWTEEQILSVPRARRTWYMKRIRMS